MSAKTLFDYIVCGYKDTPGGNTMCTFTNGWSFGTDTRRGRIAYRTYDFVTGLPRKPLYFRHWLADKLAWASISLRKGKLSRFGWYEDIRGNRAAELVDDIHTDLVFLSIGQDEDFREKTGRIMDAASELAELKGAVTWMDYSRSEPIGQAEKETT